MKWSHKKKKMCHRVVKVGFERDRKILKQTLLEVEIDAYANEHNLKFVSALKRMLKARKFFYITLSRSKLKTQA